jgi:hypothetical protein
MSHFVSHEPCSKISGRHERGSKKNPSIIHGDQTMSTNERPSADEIRSAVSESGLNLSDDDLRQLAAGDEVPVEDRHGGAETRGLSRCPGILIHRINQLCGIYLVLTPRPSIRVCCEFPTG